MAEQDADDSSSASVDTLIRDIIAGRHQPLAGDAERILNRMRQSSFSLARRNIPAPLRDLIRQHGYDVPVPGNDLIFHWAKHVLADRQWHPRTTVADYEADLRRAIVDPSSRVLVQRAYSGHDVALVVAGTTMIVPADRLGARHGPELLVVHSATVGRILSGYMVATSLPLTESPSTVWLRM